MAYIQPQATDYLDALDHAHLHRAVAVDGSAPDLSVKVDASGNFIVTGNITAANFLGFHDMNNILAEQIFS